MFHKRILKFLFLSIIFICLSSCSLNNNKKLFAIVVDEVSYSNVEKELDDYANSINEDGLKTKIIVIDSLFTPDSIRNILHELYMYNNLQGAVFVGDIPIPMISNAQHLTSTFKNKSKRNGFSKKYIPSDRFYDDFDLEFSFIKQDKLNSLFYYYSLNYDSPQNLTCDIYSGRIKPNESADKYIDLKDYLIKLVKIKKENNLLKQVMMFKGQGYNSESTLALIDETNELKKHFPNLNNYKLGLSIINFDYDLHIKSRLLKELSRKDLDLALLNNHGDTLAMYLSRGPLDRKSIKLKMGDIRRDLRKILYNLESKYDKKAVESIKEKYILKYGICECWFDTNDSIKALDSLFENNGKLLLTDFDSFTPNSKIVILNSSENGDFTQKNYFAANFIFNRGNAIVAQANTTEVLEDKWAYRYIGLLDVGIRVGQWNKLICDLETHIIGDPTFHFAINKEYSGELNVLLNHSGDIDAQFTLLKSGNDDIKAMAIRNIVDNKLYISDKLFFLYKNSNSELIRREALMNLYRYDDDNFIRAIMLACKDSNEGIRRQVMYYIRKKGNNVFINPLLSVIVKNNLSERVKNVTRGAICVCDNAQLKDIYDIEAEKFQDTILQDKLKKDIDFISDTYKNFTMTILNPKASDKQILGHLQFLKEYPYHPEVENLCDFIYLSENKKLQIAMLEYLSWFYKSYKKDYIVKVCEDIVNNKEKYDLDVRNQAQRTINIINDLSLDTEELIKL